MIEATEPAATDAVQHPASAHLLMCSHVQAHKHGDKVELEGAGY